jgi:hypothetical protein
MLDYAIGLFKAELPSSWVDGKEVLNDWLHVFPIEDYTSTLAVTLPERLWELGSIITEEEWCEETIVPNLLDIYETYLRPYGFKLQQSDDHEKLRVWFSAIDYVPDFFESVSNFVRALGYETLPHEPHEVLRFRMQEDPSRDPFMLSPENAAYAATLTAVKLPRPPRVYGGVRLSSARAAPARAAPAARGVSSVAMVSSSRGRSPPHDAFQSTALVRDTPTSPALAARRTAPQSAFFDFPSLLTVLLLFICTSAYLRAATYNAQSKSSWLDTYKHG